MQNVVHLSEIRSKSRHGKGLILKISILLAHTPVQAGFIPLFQEKWLFQVDYLNNSQQGFESAGRQQVRARAECMSYMRALR